MCVYVCVCASCVCCYRFAAAALALARSLFLSSTSYKHRKEHIDHMPLLPRVACQTTHLSTGCTLYTKVHVHADCAWRPVLFVHILDDLRTHGLPSGQSNHTATDSSHKWYKTWLHSLASDARKTHWNFTLDTIHKKDMRDHKSYWRPWSMPYIDMACLLLQVAGTEYREPSKEKILLIYINSSVILLDTIQFTNVQYVAYDDVNGSQ